MNVKEKFLALTSRTYPYGTERKLKTFLPDDISIDNHGNYYYCIGESKTIFACHLDTACKNSEIVNHVIDGNIIKTDGKTILGADDKAGVTVLLYMIENNVPGLYYFFIGEEVGCIGSKSLAKNFNKDYNKIISFDRRDTCSIITHQLWERCCSDEFANSLSEAYSILGLNLKPDDGGICTDSAQFVDIIPECTNISVGYYKEHTTDEHQDIYFLENLCKASVLIDWEELPVKRNPKDKEYKGYSYIRNRENTEFPPYRRTYNWDDDYEEPYDATIGKKRKRRKKSNKTYDRYERYEKLNNILDFTSDDSDDFEETLSINTKADNLGIYKDMYNIPLGIDENVINY